MDKVLIDKIKSNPKYEELVSKRTCFSIILTVIVFVIYYGFTLIIAFDKSLLAAKVSSDSALTIGFPMVTGIIIVSIILCGIYVVRANGEFEDLTNEIKNDVKDLVWY